MEFYPDPIHRPFTLGSGRTAALLIHGFPGTPAELRPLGERLAADGLTAHGLLLPGFGPDIERLAQTGKDVWLAAAAAEWEALRQSHAEAVLIGYSMGGAIALHLAAAHPPSHLVLLAPFWRLNTWLGRLLPFVKYLKPTLAPFEKANFGDPQLRAQFEAIAPSANLDDPVVQQRLRDEVVLPTAIIDDVRRLGVAAYDRAAQVTSPTLIIQGGQDKTVLPAHSAQLRSRLAGFTELHMIQSGHEFVRTTNKYYAFIARFLAEGLGRGSQ